MLYSGTDPESYITEYTLVYEENRLIHVNFGESVHFQRANPSASKARIDTVD